MIIAILRQLLRFSTLVLAVALLSWSAMAQQSPPAKSPFGVGPAPAEKSVAPPGASVPGGPLQRLGHWVMEKQALVHRELASAVRRFKTSDPFSAALLLAAISFAYGVLHAVGPGMGKAVISSYVLADGQTVRRGILLSFMAALIQALSALVLVGILILVLRSTGLQIRVMEAWLETLSWGLVTLVGAWLLYYQIRSMRTPAHAHAHGHGGAHTHDHASHDHTHAHDHVQLAPVTPSHVHAHAGAHGHHDHAHHAHDHGAHHHDHAHGAQHDHVHVAHDAQQQHQHDAACEMCAHLPAPSQLQGAWSWKRALALAFAVGIRPCTGAILVLVFAIGQGLWWAGVFSTLAMALGTAITVSTLAALAVGSRELAKRLAGGGSAKWADRVQMAAGLGGASLVLVLGAVFFFASLSGPAPF